MNADDQKLYEYLKKIDRKTAAEFLKIAQKYHDFRKKFSPKKEKKSTEKFADELLKFPAIAKIAADDPFFVDRILSFLAVDFDENRHENLALLRELLRQQLKNVELLSSSRARVEATILAAFSDFHREYANAFVDLFRAFQKSAADFWAAEKEIFAKISALEKLESVSALAKKPVAATLKKEFEKKKKIAPKKPISENEIRAELAISPRVFHFSLESENLIFEFADFQKKVDDALDRVLLKIKKRGVAEIAKKRDSALGKLFQCLRLADFSRVADLLAADKKGKIIAEIQKLFAEK